MNKLFSALLLLAASFSAAEITPPQNVVAAVKAAPAGANVPVATVNSPGIVQPDGNTIKITGPVISVNFPLATAFTNGIMRPDGTSIVINNGVISATPGSGLPAGMTFDGTTLTVPKVATTEVDYTGTGPLMSGPYVTVTVPSASQVPPGTAVSASVPFSGIDPFSYVVVASPVNNPGSAFEWSARIDSVGSVTVRVRNDSTSPADLPNVTFVVKAL